jgi:PAS domain-containing protein
VLPLNPQQLSSFRWDTALNIATSFTTNTEWQAYSGERDMSYLSQILGVTVQERDFIARIIEALTEGIVVIDSEARVAMVNTAARRILRWPARRTTPIRFGSTYPFSTSSDSSVRTRKSMSDNSLP